jgi:hypothetical protein
MDETMNGISNEAFLLLTFEEKQGVKISCPGLSILH